MRIDVKSGRTFDGVEGRDSSAGAGAYVNEAPAVESAVAIRSIACAICGRPRLTAAATLASSRLMMRAILSADLRSRSWERVLFLGDLPNR